MLKCAFSLMIIMLVPPDLSLAQAPSALPYNLSKPDKAYSLPPELEEISGLTYYASHQLAALNDEEGIVYVYDLKKKAIAELIRFESSGDFEGLELVGKYMYAIKSNGSLYKFSIEIDEDVEKINDPFKLENDIEGLGYNPATHQLLVALKGQGDTEDVKVKGKAIYAFDLDTQTFVKEPILVLKEKILERLWGKNRKNKTRPSGIAVHPVNGDIYVLASNGQALIVCDKNGEAKSISGLKKKLFPQPEGITFSPQGDLFISSEGAGEGGTLLHFKMNGGLN